VNFSAQDGQMKNSDFCQIQQELGLSGRELAKKLGVTPSSVSQWRVDREVPDYIARLMDFLRDEQIRKVKIPLTIEEIIALSKAAEERGMTVEALLIDVIRGLIKRSVSYTTETKVGEESPPLKVAESAEPRAPTPRKPSEGAPFIANTGLNKPAEDI
jgi:transcriptional regulator with XRE-family HTH domain